MVPDHLGAYPQDIDNLTVDRYRIPLIFIGGAVKEPRQIGTYGSQIDIAATLLGQLGLPHEEFIFSKNMLNPNSPHFGFFTFPNAFGMMTPENEMKEHIKERIYPKPKHTCKSCMTTWLNDNHPLNPKMI